MFIYAIVAAGYSISLLILGILEEIRTSNNKSRWFLLWALLPALATTIWLSLPYNEPLILSSGKAVVVTGENDNGFLLITPFKEKYIYTKKLEYPPQKDTVFYYKIINNYAGYGRYWSVDKPECKFYVKGEDEQNF